MSEPIIGLGEPYLIDPATAPALCVACYTDECGRCRPPCDCPHDGRPAPRPAGTITCEWCGFWHEPGEECPDAPATVVGVAPEAPQYVRLHSSEPAVAPWGTSWIPVGEVIEHIALWDASTGGSQVPVKLVRDTAITIDVHASGVQRALMALHLLFGPALVRKAARIRRRRERLERTEQRRMHQDYRRRQIARRRRRRQR